MITRKELKLRLLTRVENLSKYNKLSENASGISDGYKNVLEMLGYNYAQINDPASRLFEIRKLRQS